MKCVYIAADNIISDLGNSASANFNAVLEGRSGIEQIDNPLISANPVPLSLVKDIPAFEGHEKYTRFEQLCIASVKDALSSTSFSLADADTIFILSTTKGNIDILEGGVNGENIERVSLPNTAKAIGRYFNAVNTPVIISHACISGVLAVITAKRLLETGQYRTAIVTGADVLSRFVVSGFAALQALSTTPCRPFDKARNGINLGEGAATLILTTDKNAAGEQKVIVNGGAVTNDANHLTGPSRSGKELCNAVMLAMKESHKNAEDLAFISAHGTGTIFNDAMEAKAFTAAGMGDVPLHSLKGYYGHTLGAAGLIESVLSIRSLKEQVVLTSRNFDEAGTEEAVNVNREVVKTFKKHALKTASGFGGCNAAIIYSLT